jgi:hypothetical protein
LENFQAFNLHKDLNSQKVKTLKQKNLIKKIDLKVKIRKDSFFKK